ncbi:VOC family protein [Streptomyces sp. P9-A2]
MSPTKLSTVVLDAHDAHELAGFYPRLLGYEVRAEEQHWILICPRPARRGRRRPSRRNPSTYRPSGRPGTRATSR